MNQFMNIGQNQMMQTPNLYMMNRSFSTPPQPQTQNGIRWVQGIEGAKAWYLEPNSNAVLMDSENDGIFYIKVADNVGMCTLRVFRYTEITTTQQPAKQDLDLSEYVKKSELKALISELLGGMTNEQSVSANDGGTSSAK